ncbi:MAG: SDR family oxidoreductase [Bacteroidota bacterium]
MILITGATGKLGRTTVDHLLKVLPASSLAVLARDPEKAADLKALGVDVRRGDYKNPASLTAAFAGIEKLFLVSSSDLADRSTQHINVVDAAKAAGVKHIVFTSFQRKRDTGSPIQMLAQSYIDTEKHIKSSGMTYTLLRNGLYADVLPMFFGPRVLETGIFFPAGSTKSAYTVRNDMAEAAAAVLSGSGHENKEYVFATEENVSLDDIAVMLSELTGKQIGNINPTKELFIDTLTDAGVPAEMVAMSAGFAEAITLGEFASEKTDLEHLLGRKPTPLKDFFKQTYLL